MHQLIMHVDHALNVVEFVWMKILMIIWINVFVQLIMIYVMNNPQPTIYQLQNL
jgi:hypothetical protein